MKRILQTALLALFPWLPIGGPGRAPIDLNGVSHVSIFGDVARR